MQAPQPPSRHMNFVPLSSALFLIKVLRVVSGFVSPGFTGLLRNDYEQNLKYINTKVNDSTLLYCIIL